MLNRLSIDREEVFIPIRIVEFDISSRVIFCSQCHGQVIIGQYIIDYICPLYGYYRLWIDKNFCQFIPHNSRFFQSIEIKMMKGFLVGAVLIAKREAWAVHQLGAAHPFSQSFNKCCLSAAQIAPQFYNFSATQPRADLFGEP